MPGRAEGGSPTHLQPLSIDNLRKLKPQSAPIDFNFFSTTSLGTPVSGRR